MKKPHPVRHAGAPARSGMSLICALEPRMLFDGAVAATVADVAEPVETQPNDTHANDSLAATPQGSTDQRHEVAFIDSNVRDYQQLLAGMPSGTEVVILDGDQDGLQQMADYLQGRSGIDAIHILSHGDAGKVQLGNQWLDGEQLQTRSDLLAAVGESLSESGDILLYGCSVGVDTVGIDFINSLAAATGADVAASTDATGAGERNGNWILEAQTGSVEVPGLVLGSYSELLAAFNDDMGNSGGNGTTFTRILSGVSYTYTFTADGDGGDLAYESQYGAGNSASMSLMSANFNLGTTERMTITRTDLADFTFNGIYLDNQNNQNVTVAGYLDGVFVSSQTFGTGTTTLNFGGIHVDEVRITSVDFFGLAIDNFTGDTSPPSIAPSLTAAGNNPAFTENGSPVDLFSSVTATTNDTGQSFTGATFTVTNVSNGASEVLSIDGTSIGLTNGNSGSLANGGSYSVTVASGTATVTLSGMSRSNAQMNALIDNITYSNSSDDPGGNNRAVTITGITDSGGSNNTATPNIVSTVSVTPINAAPTITATGNNPTYTENGSAVDPFSGVSINTVETGQTITGMTLSVTNLADGSNEILRIDGTDILLVDGSGVTTGNGISYSVSLVGGTATISLSSAGGISAATAQNVVDGMGYRNGSDAPGTATRVITLTTVTDSGGTANGGVDTTSLSIASAVSVVTVNDAPTLSGGSFTLPSTSEDTVSDGTLVSTILTGMTYGDVDGPSLGIALTASMGNGTWQYSLDGVTWTLVGTVSNSAALLLSSNTQLRYVPDGANGEVATLTFRAWDRSFGSASANGIRSTADTTTNGGTSAFSSGTAQTSLQVAAVNDAPMASNLTQTVSYNEDPGSLVALGDIVVTDVDAGETITAILTLSNPPAGNLSTGTYGSATSTYNAGTGVWTVSGSVSDVNAALAAVAFAPATNWSQDVTIHTHIRDAAGTGPADGTITLDVTAINDAPTITAPGSISITEDVAGALTGISFTDIDAGSGNVTATFSVPSGTLSATSGSGVTVGGTASALTLTGSLADINAFIAASSVSFTTASNATANVTLTVTIDDGGNTGSGGAQTDTTSVTLMVTAVNDAPVNSVPTAQSVDQDDDLVFNSGNGNLISISDVDAGASNVEVTLAATNGLLTLGGTTGLSFTVGTGSNAATMTFSGSIADINSALNGLVFSPTGGYNGPASLQITTNDLGNSGSGGAQTDTDTISITVNSLIPQVTDVSASTADGIYKVGDTITITATFSEAVTVDTTGGIPTLLLETGSIDRLATYVSGSGGNTLTFIYTLQPGDLSADLNYQSTAALWLNGATIRGTTANDAVLTLPALGDANSLAGNKALVVDGVRPTASILMSDTALAAGETTTVTITFSEAVSGLDVADFTVANGTLSGLTSTDGGITWTATLTPDVNVEDTSNLITLDNTGYTDVAGNTGTGSTDSISYAIDTLRPTASIVVSDTALSIGETATVTITFSEAVSGLTVSDFTVANGALSGLSSSDGGITWTATLMPDANVEDTSNLITLDNTGVQDTAGNSGAGTTDSNSYAIDTQRPAVVSIVVNDAALAAGETTTVTITFSEAVSGLMVSDFAVANGALSELASIDGGITWTATLIPTSGVEDTSNLITLDNTGYIDAAGNTGTGSTDSNNYAIDTQRPTASIMVSDPALSVGETSTVTVTFSEAVAGLTVSDFAVVNGSLSDLSSSDGGVIWTATLTPNANVEDTSNLITLDNTGYIDAAGNTGTGSTDSNAYAIDTLRPTATIVASDTALSVGETTTVTITFSEAVSGLSIEDFAVANGALSELASIDGGITWTVTLTPDANIEDTSNLITLNNTGYTDAAGNTGSGSTDSNAYAIDTQRPTANIVVSDTALSVGETTTVTISFSEAVAGLDLADFSVVNGTLSGLSSSDGGIIWTATLTPDANIEDTSNLITLDNTGYTDAAGNTGTGSTDSNAYAIDTQRLTASIVVGDVALSVGETSTVTITFSEAVSGLSIEDFAVANGTLSELTSVDGGITWTAILTPASSVENTSNLITLDNTGVQDAAGNSGAGTTDSNSYTIDTQRPTASIMVSDATLAAGETATVTITFSEAVSGLDTADFSVANGGLSDLSSSDGGITWTATLTPDANIEDTSNLITLDNTGYTDAAGNTGSGTTDSNNYAIDTQRPTASIVVSDTALSVGETNTVTITFSEAVSGLMVSDFAVANGALSGLSSSDGGITWTATLTPDANIEDTSNLITLDNTGYTDAAGNTGTGTADSNNYAIDTQRPTVSIVVSDTALSVGETTTVTITFSEAVSGLDTADFSVANGSLSGLSSSDGGITWTTTLTPDANIEDTSNLITLDNTGVTDLAGNAGSGATDSNNYAIDTQRPTASIVVSDTALAAGETATVTITFSEAVTGLTTADFSVANGSLSGLSSSDGGVTWTATLTPDTNIEDTSNLITLDNTGYTDAAGNTGSGTTDSNNYAIDTQRPTASIMVSDTALAAGETATVTITFSEAVTGLTTADFSVANGSLSGLSSSDGGVTWTATLTPDTNIEDTSNLIILDNTGVTDLAGNAGSGATDSNNYAIDTQRPTASIVVSDTALAAGDTTTVIITFSEVVTGLTMADFSVTNGTLSGLSSSDGGITWTATLTPDTNVEDTSNLITLDNNGVQDAAGNSGTGTTDSNSYAIDTQRPAAVSIVVGDLALATGETTTVTITFSEVVSGLDLADFTVANGTLSGLSSSDGGITWTATLTPSANVENAANLITLNNAGYTDVAGNTGSGTTDSNSYAIDTLRPTASIVVSDAALAAGETSTITITFNEAVTGLDLADLSVANGSLSGLSSSDGGITWTATLTPDANIEDTSNLITLDNAGVTDLAGNAGSGTTDSNSYAIDTQRPTASIVVSDTALAAGETATVTITFSEAVTGLLTADFSVANGSLSGLSSSDGGITWTATLTPSANVENAANLITLNNAGYIDTAGNTGTGNTGTGTTDSNNYAIDTLRPTASIVVSDTALVAGETATVTITFSEAVTGLTKADFSVANGSLSGLFSSDGGVTWTATLTPDVNVEDTSNLIILDNTGYTDTAGNTGTGTTDSNNYAIDTLRPTASIVVSDTALLIGDTATVTITFSEAVSGLDVADFTIANGTLSGLTSADGGITWTATLTPNANVEDTANLITLNNAAVQDAAGNTGSGTTDSNSYAIDTQRPTATIEVSDTELSAGETTTVTITFSEAVSGLDIADFTVANGTLSGLTSADGGITWTATLTPDANIEDASNLITLDNTRYIDAAGNTGSGTTDSNNYVIDTQIPTVNNVSVPLAVHYSAGDTLTFVVNTSEVVIIDGTPRLVLDIGGTMVFADYVAGSGTNALVFQYSVQAGLNDADGITVAGLEINGGSLHDASGNAMDLTLNNVGDTSGVVVDTTAPNVSAIVAMDPSPTNARTVRYTVTFSEDVSGVDLSDFGLVTTGNVIGNLGNLVQIDGRTYQVTINDVAGNGTLALALADSGTLITDAAGNALTSGLIGQSYILAASTGDPEFRSYPPSHNVDTPSVSLQPALPSVPPPTTTSPLLPPPLFEVPTLGSGIPTLGNIFINQNPLAPSYIAQVFASSSDVGGDGSGIGFLGFGGGDGGVFGSSSLSSLFGQDVLQENEQLEVFDGKKWGAGHDGGIFGAPTLGQQLNDLREGEQSQLRELAQALQQIAAAQSPS